MAEVEAELARRLEEGQEVLLATVIRIDGRPPSRPGAKALFDRQGPLAGTLGCSEFDSAARSDAPALLEAGAPAVRMYRHDLGSIEVYLEPYLRRPLLVVLGDTPVAAALRRWAPEAGFRLGEPDGSELYVVHTDHDAPDLVQRLAELLGARPRFVGLMGSRRHTGPHLEALAAMGLTPDEIGRIQSPVGLDIGARTPEEIAVSILAGLIATRRGKSGGWLERAGR